METTRGTPGLTGRLTADSVDAVMPQPMAFLAGVALVLSLIGCGTNAHIWKERTEVAVTCDGKPIRAVHTYGSLHDEMILRFSLAGREEVYVLDWVNHAVGVPNTRVRFFGNTAVSARPLTSVSIQSPKWTHPSQPLFDKQSVAFRTPDQSQISVTVR